MMFHAGRGKHKIEVPGLLVEETQCSTLDSLPYFGSKKDRRPRMLTYHVNKVCVRGFDVHGH